MDSLKKIIQLAKADGGKFFVIDEQGEPLLVIMPIEEYENVLLHKVKNQVEDIEEINSKILEAQRQDILSEKLTYQDQLKSEVIDSTFDFESSRAAQLEDF